MKADISDFYLLQPKQTHAHHHFNYICLWTTELLTVEKSNQGRDLLNSNNY